MSRPITTFCLSLLLLAACSRTPEIVPQGLPDATVSEVFLVRLGAERGKGTLTWSLAEGELPEGLVLNPAGVISGTPERSGSYAFTLTVEDQRGRTDQRAYTLEVMWSGPALLCGEEVVAEVTAGATDDRGTLDPTVDGGVTWVTVPMPPEGTTRLQIEGITSDGFGFVYAWIGGAEASPGDTDVDHYFQQDWISGFSDGIVIDLGSYPSLQTLQALDQPLTLMFAGPDPAEFTLTAECTTGPVFQDLHPPADLVGMPLTANFNVFGDNAGVRIWTEDPLPSWMDWNESNGRITGMAEEEGVWEFTIKAEDADGNIREEQASLATFAHHPIGCGDTVQFEPAESMYEGDRVYSEAPLSYRIYELPIPPDTGLVEARLTGTSRPYLATSGVGTGGSAYADRETYSGVLAASGASWPRLDDYRSLDEPLYIHVGHQEFNETNTLTLEIVCDDAPRLARANLPVLQPDSGSITLFADGGTEPISWEATGLPAGVTLSADGVLTADSPALGTSTVDLTLTDVEGRSSTTAYDLHVGWNAACGGVPQLTCGERDAGLFETTIYDGGPRTDYTRQFCIPGPTSADGAAPFRLDFSASEDQSLGAWLYAPGQSFGGDTFTSFWVYQAGQQSLPLSTEDAGKWLDTPFFVEIRAYGITEWEVAVDCE